MAVPWGFLLWRSLQLALVAIILGTSVGCGSQGDGDSIVVPEAANRKPQFDVPIKPVKKKP